MCPDLSHYVLKTSIPPCPQAKVDDTIWMLRSDCTSPDMSRYVLKSSIPEPVKCPDCICNNASARPSRQDDLQEQQQELAAEQQEEQQQEKRLKEKAANSSSWLSKKMYQQEAQQQQEKLQATRQQERQLQDRQQLEEAANTKPPSQPRAMVSPSKNCSSSKASFGGNWAPWKQRPASAAKNDPSAYFTSPKAW